MAVSLSRLRHGPRLARNFVLKRVPRTYRIETGLGFSFTGNTRDVIQRYVYVFGVWEPHMSAFVARHVRPGDGALDVGANVGYYTCLLASRVGRKGSVRAYEPLPALHAHLTRNVALNGFGDRVTVVRAAAGNVRGDVQVYPAPAGNLGSATTFQRAGHAGAVVAPVVPLAEDLDADFVARLRIIKIDVEGDELNVLRGLTPVLDRVPRECVLLLEISPSMLAERGQSPDEVFGDLRQAGYLPYRVPNSYAPRAYVDGGGVEAPKRFRDRPNAISGDFVFSRVDADEL